MQLTGGEVFRSHRERRSLSQEDVAAEIGVSAGAVSQWENGRVTPRRSTALRADRALGADGEIVAAFGYGAITPPADDDLRSRLEQLERLLVDQQEEMAERDEATNQALVGLQQTLEQLQQRIEDLERREA